jgi:hypothetical protein
MHVSCRGLYALLAGGALLLGSASSAFAQFTPETLNDPATGEKFHIEGTIGFWAPNADLNISSDQFGISGSAIDFKRDLGLVDHKFTEMHLLLRPARKHKLRLQFVPIRYEQQGTLSSDIVFNGQRFRAGFPVTSELKWNAYRFGYEYDFISKNRGFGGIILEAKYTDILADLRSPNMQQLESSHQQLPIPSLGGIARVYVVPNISATFEMTGIAIPQAITDQFSIGGHYKELQAYGTINLTNNIGFQGGYRALDLGYLQRASDGSTASLLLKGVFFGLTARY